MKRMLIASVAAAAMISAATAQPTTTQPTTTPSVTTTPVPPPPANRPTDPGAPLPGANSFTEGQARSRLEANGYSGITDLRKDDQGIWRGRATFSGASVAVAVDYRGNIVRN